MALYIYKANKHLFGCHWVYVHMAGVEPPHCAIDSALKGCVTGVICDLVDGGVIAILNCGTFGLQGISYGNEAHYSNESALR